MDRFEKEINLMRKRLSGRDSLLLKQLNQENTALFIIDMIGGFAKKGALYSDRTEKLIPNIAAFSQKCKEKQIDIIAFADSHPADSPEFKGYPTHCLEGTEESRVISELSGYSLFPKNSTNGLFAPGFLDWLEESTAKEYFVITGVCTDICVYQFAVGLKCWFNQKNIEKHIIVPTSLVDTFDMDGHNAELQQLVFLNSMLDNGVEVVKNII